MSETSKYQTVAAVFHIFIFHSLQAPSTHDCPVSTLSSPLSSLRAVSWASQTMWPLGRRALGFLELNEETDWLEGNWILRSENLGKKPGFRRRKRESTREDISTDRRDGLRLEREEIVMDCGRVAMKNLRIRCVRDWVYIYKYEKREIES